jgi:ribonuclease HI
LGAGLAIKRPGTPTVKLMYKMDTRSSNNQAKAFAILKALEYIQNTQINEEDKAVTVHTDSRTTLDSLNNTDIHAFPTEEIRQIVHELEIREWKIRFRWIKAHAGTSGKNWPTSWRKKHQENRFTHQQNRVPKSVMKSNLENTRVEI